MDQQKQTQGGGNKEVRAWVRITQEDKELLEKVAEQYSLTPSQYLRVVLKKTLSEEVTLSPKHV